MVELYVRNKIGQIFYFFYCSRFSRKNLGALNCLDRRVIHRFKAWNLPYKMVCGFPKIDKILMMEKPKLRFFVFGKKYRIILLHPVDISTSLGPKHRQ
jgi:hypothetical protein